MGWRRTYDKLLSEPIITQLTDAYMRHRELIPHTFPAHTKYNTVVIIMP